MGVREREGEGVEMGSEPPTQLFGQEGGKGRQGGGASSSTKHFITG